MAYKKKDLEKLALKVIEKYQITNIQRLANRMPVSKRTIYNKKLHELPTIKEAIQDNVVNLKESIESKLYESNHPTALIALYKIHATPEERDALNGSTTVNTNVRVGMDLTPMPMQIVPIGYEHEVDKGKEND